MAQVCSFLPSLATPESSRQPGRTLCIALSLAAILCGGAKAQVPRWHTVASDVIADSSHRTHLAPGAQFYTFESPANTPLRHVAFGEQVAFVYTGMQPGAQYRVRLSFTSDGPRTESVTIDGQRFIDRIELAVGTPTFLERDLPPYDFAKGRIALEINRVSGPNAVVSAVEILSDSPKSLAPYKPAAESDADPKVSPSELAAVMPILTPRPKGHLVDLSGSWKFSATPAAGFEKATSQPDWTGIAVPGEWVMQGFQVKPGTWAGYFRTFSYLAPYLDRRIKIRFSAVYSLCRVYVNGKYVGGHEGGFVPFECDITGAIRQGLNTLALAVCSESKLDVLSSASTYAAHPLGGITRKVQLFEVPAIHISDLRVETRFDAQFRNAVLIAHCLLSSGSNKTQGGFALSGSVLGKRRERTFPELRPGGAIRVDLEIPISHPPKWDCEHPNLRTLDIFLRKRHQTTEVVSESVGFRQVDIKGNQVFVNGCPIKLRGVCRHEVHPILGRALSEALWKEDARIFREMNCNFIRTSHYPPAEEFLTECDQRGLFVELEAPLCWVREDVRGADAFRHILRAELDTVWGYPNHPCVIVRSLANESAWTPTFAKAAAYVRLADPTRPLSFHDQCWGSYNNRRSNMPIGIFHYPDMNGPAAADLEPRPIQFGEFCHLNTYNRRETFTDPGVRDYYGYAIKPMWDRMYRSKGNLGGSIWSGVDDVFLLPDGRGVGYGEWGPIDGWRRLKPEAWNIKKAYSPVRVLSAKTTGGKTVITLENRHVFSDLAELKIEWAMLRSPSAEPTTRLEPCKAHLAPGKTGTFTIPTAAGSYLLLRFIEPDGMMADVERLPLGSLQPSPVAPQSISHSGPLRIQESDSVITVGGDSFSWMIDKTSGQIAQGVAQGQTILTGGPTLMMLPLTSGPCATEYGQTIQPLNDVCTNWRHRSVAVAKSDSSVTIKVAGSYDEASGSYSMTFDSTGGLRVDYSFTSKIDMSPRQWGMAFTVPASQSRITWKRDTLWTAYPAGHIGRPEGTASAVLLGHIAYLSRTKPSWPWEQDENALGSADFRSTRAHIRSFTIDDPSRKLGLTLASDGRQAVRAWRLGTDRIGWLAAAFNTGGGESFLSNASYSSEFRPIHVGSVLSDRISIKVTEPR
ncbi:MAG: glycoside hydrolase family 2 TIM barrel-domain containing protein [Fimbriimonas sp.]|nr:glycoside hydrolase family 2 TIM barrel-domain containing protein [Fimbriimonas sp.]